MDEKEIRVLLLSIGFRPSYKGFPYLINVLSLASNETDHIKLIKLYKLVGERFNVSPSLVHQNICSLLKAYSDSGNTKILEKLIGYKIYEKLTIKEFVYIIVDYLEK